MLGFFDSATLGDTRDTASPHVAFPYKPQGEEQMALDTHETSDPTLDPLGPDHTSLS